MILLSDMGITDEASHSPHPGGRLDDDSPHPVSPYDSPDRLDDDSPDRLILNQTR
jgi:hypothetical protein